LICGDDEIRLSTGFYTVSTVEYVENISLDICPEKLYNENV
jgi:hypothetical protein